MPILIPFKNGQPFVLLYVECLEGAVVHLLLHETPEVSAPEKSCPRGYSWTSSAPQTVNPELQAFKPIGAEGAKIKIRQFNI